MNNTTQITEALKGLIVKDNRAFVAMLSGEWGIGKTYFWNDFTKKNLQNKDVVYISLFGKNSLQDIETEILTKLSRFNQFKEQNKTILSHLKKAISFVSNASGFPVSIASGAILSLFDSNNFKNIIICFDDFERLSDKVSLKDVMGLISQFKEQKECKVIMILNEQELDKLSNIDGKKHNEIFALYKEKVVDYNFHYHPSQEKLFEAIKEDIKKITFCEIETIYNFLKKIDLKNIRIMKQSLYLLEKFSFIESEDYHKKVIDEFVEIALNIFVFKAKTNYTYSEFYDFLTSSLLFNYRYDSPESPENSKNLSKKDLEEKHKINLKYYFREENRNDYSINKRLIEKELYTFIDTHFIDKEKFKTLLENNNKYITYYDIRAELYKINNRFMTDFSTSNKQITQQLFEFIKQHQEDMPRLFLYSDYKIFIQDIKKFISKIEKTDKDIIKNYIDFYIKHPEYEEHDLVDDKSQLELIISDYPWAKEYTAKRKRDILKIELTNIKPIIQQAIENKNYSKDIEYKLNLISINEYKKLIKQDPNFVELLIDFLKLHKPTNIIDALQSLENENDYYKWKINQIQQKINQGKNK